MLHFRNTNPATQTEPENPRSGWKNPILATRAAARILDLLRYLSIRAGTAAPPVLICASVVKVRLN